MEETNKDFLSYHKEGLDTLGFWKEERLTTIKKKLKKRTPMRL